MLSIDTYNSGCIQLSLPKTPPNARYHVAHCLKYAYTRSLSSPFLPILHPTLYKVVVVGLKRYSTSAAGANAIPSQSTFVSVKSKARSQPARLLSRPRSTLLSLSNNRWRDLLLGRVLLRTLPPSGTQPCVHVYSYGTTCRLSKVTAIPSRLSESQT